MVTEITGDLGESRVREWQAKARGAETDTQ